MSGKHEAPLSPDVGQEVVDSGALFDEISRGFDPNTQELVLGERCISMQIPGAGACKMERVVPREPDGASKLHFTWEGTPFYYDLEIAEDGKSGWATYRTDRGVANGSILFRKGKTPLEACAFAIEQYINSPWVYERIPSAEA